MSLSRDQGTDGDDTQKAAEIAGNVPYGQNILCSACNHGRNMNACHMDIQRFSLDNQWAEACVVTNETL